MFIICLCITSSFKYPSTTNRQRFRPIWSVICRMLTEMDTHRYSYDRIQNIKSTTNWVKLPTNGLVPFFLIQNNKQYSYNILIKKTFMDTSLSFAVYYHIAFLSINPNKPIPLFVYFIFFLFNIFTESSIRVVAHIGPYIIFPEQICQNKRDFPWETSNTASSTKERITSCIHILDFRS